MGFRSKIATYHLPVPMCLSPITYHLSVSVCQFRDKPFFGTEVISNVLRKEKVMRTFLLKAEGSAMCIIIIDKKVVK
jgi:hypothetical protein